MKLWAIALALFLLSPIVTALEASSETTIAEVNTYQTSAGDVIFKLTSPATICAGYWLSPAESGFEQSYSLVLSAFHADQDVIVYGLDGTGDKWAGSSTHFCKVDSIVIKR